MNKPRSVSITSTPQNYLHDIQIGEFELRTDEPPALGGRGEAPAPFDYYLAALASCTAITLRMYCQRKGWDLGQFEAELTLTFDDGGRVAIHRVLRSDANLDDAMWERLLEVVANTPVTRAMREGATITSARASEA